MNPDIQKAFHEAVSHNDIETARRMIAAGADVNAPYDEYENRSFLDACYKGNLALVKMLVDAGADVNLPDACGVVPLVRAIVSVHDTDAVLNYLIDSGADVNGKERAMSPPLHEAVSENDIKIAEQLLEAGANPNLVDDEGQNALFAAVNNNNESMIRLLLSHGADINHEDNDGHTPLSFACTNGNDKLCELLLEHGAKCDGVYSFTGNTVLMDAVYGENPNCVKLILNQGVDVNEKNASLDTALSLAIFYGTSLNIIEELLAAGADPNVELAWGRTPLTLAVREENFWAVQLLLRRGCTFETPSEYYDDSVLSHTDDYLLYKSMAAKGFSLRTDDEAVVLYARHACTYLLRKALEAGANPNAADAMGKSALAWALEHPRRSQGCAARLIQHGAKYDSKLIIYAVRTRKNELFRALIKAGADVNISDERGNTALHYATRTNRDYFVRDLIEAKANIEARNKANSTPLMLAIQHRCYSSAGCLLSNKADKYAINSKYDETALAMCRRYHCKIENDKLIKTEWSAESLKNLTPFRFCWAAQSGNRSKIQFLKEQGLDINAQDDEGITALHLGSDQEEVIPLLIQSGADMYIETYPTEWERPYTPAMLAAEDNKLECLKKFLDCGYDVNHKTSRGTSLLMICAANYWPEGVKFLLEHGANPSLKDNDGRTALFYATSWNIVCYVESILYLLEYGANINEVDNDGNTALLQIAHDEIDGDDTHLVLIGNGIDVNIRNNAGQTALSIAKHHGHKRLIEALIEAGATDN